MTILVNLRNNKSTKKLISVQCDLDQLAEDQLSFCQQMINAYFQDDLAFKYAHQAKKSLLLLEKVNVNTMKMYKGIDLNILGLTT